MILGEFVFVPQPHHWNKVVLVSEELGGVRWNRFEEGRGHTSSTEKGVDMVVC